MRKIFKLTLCAVVFLLSADVVMAQTADKNILLNVFTREKDNGNGAMPEAFLKCRVETLKEGTALAYEIFRSCIDPQEYVFYEIWPPYPRALNKSSASFIPNRFPTVATISIFSSSVQTSL